MSGITGGEGSFIGTAAFSDVAGQVRYETDEGGANVYIDADGNGIADAGFRLASVTISWLQADFVL